MDGFINPSLEKQTIYEIYRACRLCGAGAGYKMPIMQNVVHLDGAEVELTQKIRECVQIEVHQEDKMPPLICELCVDKVNDFYEFLEMCRQTNKRTRLRLGLPPQTMPRGAPDAGDCILGVTEPVYLNEDSNESLLKPRARNKGKFIKESVSTKKTKSKQNEMRSLRNKYTSTPSRASKRSREEDISLSMLQKTRQSEMPKSILRKEKEIKVEEDWSPSRSKRSRDTREAKPDIIKKVKIVEKPLKSPPKQDFKCKTCKVQFNNSKALNNHMRIHNRPPAKYKNTTKQEKKNSCTKCKKEFPNKLSLDRHKCAKTSTNKCSYCGKQISNVRNLANHERACQRKELKISPKLLKQLRPIQIRVKRCDPLLKKVGDHYDVSGVDCIFGLDKNCIYPYLKSLRIKTEPSYMVNIHDTIDEFDLNQDYVHWDSDSSKSNVEMTDIKEKSVETLANLSLRTIFSHKFLGKVPKRKRTVKHDKTYDSILNFDSEVRLGIDNIINSLDNDKSVNDRKDNDNDSLFDDDDKKTPTVSNEDFDSLFCSNEDSKSNLSDDKSKPDDVNCEIVNKNNVIENKHSENVNEINNGFTVLHSIDSIDHTQKTEDTESSEVVPVNVNIPNSKILSSVQDSIIKATSHTDEENILKNNVNTDKVNTDDEEKSISLKNEKIEQTDKVIEDIDSGFDKKTKNSSANINDNDGENTIAVNDRDVPINKASETESSGVNVVSNDSTANDNDKNVNDTPINEEVKDNDNKLNKGAPHVNGDDKVVLDELEDISDSEIDDSRLMDAIDEQIGEKKTEDKSQDKDIDSVSVVKSVDLESILSDELPNE